MPTELVILWVVVGALGATVAIVWSRLERLRRRAKRSMLVGPENHLRLMRQVYDRLAAAECRAAGITPRLPVEFRSEWGEDVLLYDLFFPQATGVYIEAGALDGRRNSVSWVFEALGWTGLLVEPIPERVAECRLNRPGSKVVHAALGPAESSGTTAFMVPEREEHQLSGYREHEGMGDEHMLALERAGATLRRVDVPLTSLDRELAAAGFDRVDFASIDVEGGELEVLRGFDLERFRPRVLVIEDLTLGRDGRTAEFATARGYDQIMWIGANRVFVRRDEPGLLARAARLAETVYSPLVRPRGGHADSAAHDLA